ncbi:type I-E CRISPR-associated protein Cse2/CasB [Saccharopolyspora thermophila]|uniref:Type I-E CRISPR-associated protein Cse2/CasB n=1 Tax=Saccharopolyspora thermophila TaxID=89367 RepID=A0ABP3MLY2_9PSEU
MPDPVTTRTTQQDSAPRHTRAERLVQHIRSRVLPDPGRRAALRAAVGLEPGEPRTFHAIREIARFLPADPTPATERAFLAVAAMMCAQPPRGRKQDLDAGKNPDGTQDSADNDGQGASAQTADTDDAATNSTTRFERAPSLGESCAKAVTMGRAKEATIESRLHSLCRGSSAQVHRQLPALVSYLGNLSIPVHWAGLIDDLAAWDRSRHQIAARWLRDFHRNTVTPIEKADNDKENA